MTVLGETTGTKIIVYKAGILDHVTLNRLNVRLNASLKISKMWATGLNQTLTDEFIRIYHGKLQHSLEVKRKTNPISCMD